MSNKRKFTDMRKGFKLMTKPNEIKSQRLSKRLKRTSNVETSEIIDEVKRLESIARCSQLSKRLKSVNNVETTTIMDKVKRLESQVIDREDTTRCEVCARFVLEKETSVCAGCEITSCCDHMTIEDGTYDIRTCPYCYECKMCQEFFDIEDDDISLYQDEYGQVLCDNCI